MSNKILNKKDLEVFKNQIKDNNYPQNFPHADLWGKDDAILKWISVLNEFKSLGKNGLKVVDLGSGSGCTPHIISSWGNDVTAIDISNIVHFCPNSLVKMIFNDALVETKKMDESSVDVFIDLCAVTHFNINYTNSIANIGWKEIGDQVYRVLKPNGKFIISSDVNILNDFGEFIKPERIIEILQSSGLKLAGEYNKESEDTDFSVLYGGENLQVVCLIFEK